ncbi:MAG: NosD domain-containing protein, partial [Candidatus Micrarchaeia archaeon]
MRISKEIIILLIFSSIFVRSASAITYINDCRTLNIDGEVYILNNSIVSSQDTCIDITGNNIILDCQNYKIQGTGTYGIKISRSTYRNTNITVKNCKIDGWVNGVYLSQVTNNTFFYNTFTSNSYGIYINNSNYNIFFKNTIDSITGIYLKNSYYGNNITSNTIKGSQYALYLHSANKTIIYNNLINGSVLIDGIYINFFNVTKQLGERIYSSGREIGGNYWTDPYGNGFSDTCKDDDCDGFCNSAKILDAYNRDNLPLSNKYDKIPPTYQHNSTTTPYAGYPINFSIYWQDNCAGLSYYEFWLDNCTNSLKLIKSESMPSLTSTWINLTNIRINSTVGCRVRWQFRVRDTNYNWNNTTFTFYTIQPPCLEMNLSSPSSYLEIIQGRILLVDLNFTCKYIAQCNNISVLLRYNKTSILYFPISETEGAKPFYIVKTRLLHSNYYSNTNLLSLDNELDDDDLPFLQFWNGDLFFNYSFAPSDSTLYLLVELTNFSSSFQAYIAIYNFSSDSWYVWLNNNFQERKYYSISINLSSGLVKDNKVMLHFYAGNSLISIYNIYLQSRNNTLIGNLAENQSQRILWEVNVTGDYNSAWLINAFLYSPEIQNSTPNSLIKIFSGIMNVDLTSPLDGMNFKQYSTITVRGRVSCDGNCGNISGILKYNKTYQFPDTPISSVEGNKPFYIISNSSFCSGSCDMQWVLNVTGEKYTEWKIGITISSDLIVGEKTSNNISVRIIPRNCSQKPFLINEKLRITVECEGQYYSFTKSREEFNIQYPWKAELNLYQISSTLKNFMVGFGNGNLDSYGRPSNSYVFEFNDTHVRFLNYNSSLIEEL